MYISKFIKGALLGITAVLMMANSGMAQSKVLVVDTNRLLYESEVGKHVTRQLQTIATTMDSELATFMTPVQAKEQSLQSDLIAFQEQNKGKTREEVMQSASSRPDIQKKAIEVQQGKQILSRGAQVKQYELSETQKAAQRDVIAKIDEITYRIAKERGADVVIEKKFVVYSDPVDITDAVMTRLNSEFPRITVVRKRMPQPVAAPQSAK